MKSVNTLEIAENTVEIAENTVEIAETCQDPKVCKGYGDLCKHFPTICPMCTAEESDDKAYECDVYYVQCFYCLLDGSKILEVESESYGETLGQGHDATLIGHRDGREGRKMAKMNCEVKTLELLYRFGYNAGDTLRGYEAMSKVVNYTPYSNNPYSHHTPYYNIPTSSRNYI